MEDTDFKLPTKKKKSKKKKKKEKSVSILQEIDKSMNVTYSNIIEEVEYYQMLVEEADRKAERNARKALRKKNQLYSSDYKKKGRLRVIEEIEGRGFLDRIQNSLKDVSQIIIVLARLVAGLILSILSFEPIKALIKPETMRKIDKVYSIAMGVGAR